ncbi:PLP-dependent transferase, partial [Aerococcus urinae]
GLVACSRDDLGEKLDFQLNTTGATLSVFDSWLVIRGLKTLALRFKQHEKNARAVVDYLKEEPLVTAVNYPGRGGMLSFAIKDTALIS